MPAEGGRSKENSRDSRFSGDASCVNAFGDNALPANEFPTMGMP
jgi:hypothetical protein